MTNAMDGRKKTVLTLGLISRRDCYSSCGTAAVSWSLDRRSWIIESGVAAYLMLPCARVAPTGMRHHPAHFGSSSPCTWRQRDQRNTDWLTDCLSVLSWHALSRDGVDQRIQTDLVRDEGMKPAWTSSRGVARGGHGCMSPVAVGQFFHGPRWCSVGLQMFYTDTSQPWFDFIVCSITYQTSQVLVVCLFFLSTCLQLLGPSPPDPRRGSAPGPRWGTSVPQTPWFVPPLIKFLAPPDLQLGAVAEFCWD